MKTQISKIAIVLLTFVLFIAGAKISLASNWNGNANDDDWFNPTNWSAGVPSSTESAIIGIVDTVNISGAAAEASVLTLNNGNLNIADDLTVYGQSIWAPTGTGTVTQSAGAVDFHTQLYLGGSVYNYNAGTLAFGSLIMRGNGEFNQNNAVNPLIVDGTLQIGMNNVEGTSIFKLNGNRVEIGGNLDFSSTNALAISSFDFGNPATAQLVFNGAASGINVVGTNEFVIPAGLTAGLTVPGQSIIGGGAGYSDIRQEGGAVVFNGPFYAGSAANDGMKDQYNYNGGTLQFASLIVRGWGEFNHNNSDAPLVITGDFVFGSSNSPGESSFNLNGNHVRVGGSLNIGVAAQPDKIVAFNFGDPATANLEFTGGASGLNIIGPNSFVVPAGLMNPITFTGQSIIGSGNGESVYRQDGGTVSFNGTNYLSNTDNTGGETDKIILNGGTLNFNGTLNLRRQGLLQVNGGTLNMGAFVVGSLSGYVSAFESTGGTSNFTGTVTLDSLNDAQIDEFNVSGGTVNLNGATTDLVLAGRGVADISGGTVNVGRNLNVGTLASSNSTIDQSGGLVDVSGNLDLATNGTATGSYNLTGGTLNVAGTIDLDGDGTESFVLDGGTLQAVDISDLEGNFTFTSGTLTPGEINVPETLSFNGDLIMNPGSKLLFDLSTSGIAGGPNDLLDVSGNLTLDGLVDVNALPDFSGVGKFPIITFSGLVSGTLGVTDPSSMWVTIEGNTVFLTIVPEPNSALLLGTGLIGLAWRSRRRRA